MGADEHGAREVHSTWIDAVNAGDLACLLSLIADDAVFLTPDHAPFGRDEFSANFVAAHRRVRIRCVSELEEVAVVGEAAQLAGIASQCTANSPTAAGFWPGMPTRLRR